jgi:LPXTG-motif cell wall-anchored protein
MRSAVSTPLLLAAGVLVALGVTALAVRRRNSQR